MTVYNSRVSNGSFSIKDCDNGDQTCNEPTSAYGSPAVGYLVGILNTLALDFAGQVGELVTFDRVLTEAEACQLCRCGTGNQYGRDGSSHPVSIDTSGDRFDECNSCTLPSPATHCGVGRIM